MWASNPKKKELQASITIRPKKAKGGGVHGVLPPLKSGSTRLANPLSGGERKLLFEPRSVTPGSPARTLLKTNEPGGHRKSKRGGKKKLTLL